MADSNSSAALALTVIGGVFVILGGLLLTLLLIGVIGIVVGIVMIIGAFAAHQNPQSRTTWGVLIIVMSILSIFFALAGFVIGFILSLIGGILFLIPSTPEALPPTRVCPRCGNLVSSMVMACPYCGQPFMMPVAQVAQPYASAPYGYPVQPPAYGYAPPPYGYPPPPPQQAPWPPPPRP